MKIAICDDNLIFLQEMSAYLEQYAKENTCYLDPYIYTNPLELAAQVENGVRYDAIFLDVFMPGINGIQCAKDIRTHDSYVKIIFLTSSAEFAIESYSVKAYDYLLKPIQREKLFEVLNRLEREIHKTEKNIVIIKCKTGIVKVALSEVEYCEMLNRKIVIHMADSREYECNLKMTELEAYGMFLRPHRSFLVNMNHIREFTSKNIVLDCGVEVPIPREKYARMKQEFMDYIFSCGSMDLLLNPLGLSFIM